MILQALHCMMQLPAEEQLDCSAQDLTIRARPVPLLCGARGCCAYGLSCGKAYLAYRNTFQIRLFSCLLGVACLSEVDPVSVGSQLNSLYFGLCIHLRLHIWRRGSIPFGNHVKPNTTVIGRECCSTNVSYLHPISYRATKNHLLHSRLPARGREGCR